MSTRFVVGIIPPDEKFKKMKQIYELCDENNVTVPDEVHEFFNGNTPNDDGYDVSIETELDNDYEFVIDVKKIPKNVRFIKAYWMIN